VVCGSKSMKSANLFALYSLVCSSFKVAIHPKKNAWLMKYWVI
jgi:hypothetical protein